MLSRNIYRVARRVTKTAAIHTYIQATPTQQNIRMLMTEPQKVPFVFRCSVSSFCPSAVDCTAMRKIRPGKKGSGHLALAGLFSYKRNMLQERK